MISNLNGFALFITFATLASLFASGDEPVSPTVNVQNAKARPVAASLQSARSQATSLHEVMHSTLRVTHDHYYREDEGLPIPASILKEVFADLKRKQGITLRWLVVEGQAMNTDHEPQNDFEKTAARALKSGQPIYEQFDNGVYRRAGPITLSNHCLKCHVPDRRNTNDRIAGLLITIPAEQKSR